MSRHFRPLSLGEIFDGGLTVFVRTARRAAIVIAIAGSIEEIATIPFFVASGALQTIAFVVLAIVLGVTALIAYAMLLHVFACEARGISCTLRQAARRASERFGQLFLAILVVGIPAVLFQLALSVGVLIGIGKTFAYLSTHVTGQLVQLLQVVALIFALILVLAVFALIVTFFSVTASAIVAEYVEFRTAIVRAWRRCFSRRKLWRRTIAVGAAWVGPYFVVSILVAALLAAFPIGRYFTPLVQAIAQGPAIALGTAWTTVYSLDAAIRLEAFDLVAEADAILDA